MKCYGLQKLITSNDFMGISDASYSAMDHPFDYNKFSANTPMWGDLYSLDFAKFQANRHACCHIRTNRKRVSPVDRNIK